MEQPEHKGGRPADPAGLLGSGIKDEKLAFADLADGRPINVAPQGAEQKSKLYHAAEKDAPWQMNAQHLLFSLSKGREGLEASQTGGSHEHGKHYVKKVVYHPHLTGGADPSASGNPHPEWLIRRPQSEQTLLRADGSQGPSIVRTEFSKATVLHAEISQERLEFLLEVESKALRLQEENAQLREDLKWRSKGHSQMETDLLGVMAEWRGKVGEVEATLEAVTHAQRQEIEALRAKIETMYPAEVVEKLREDLAKLLADMATADDLKARDACIQELGAHLQVAHDSNQKLQGELDALQLRYQTLEAASKEDVEQLRQRMATLRESTTIVQSCKSCMTELPDLYAQVNLLRGEVAGWKRSHHTAIEREAHRMREHEHRAAMMAVEIREAKAVVQAVHADLESAATGRAATERQVQQLTAILHETEGRLQTVTAHARQLQDRVDRQGEADSAKGRGPAPIAGDEMGLVYGSAAEFSANETALAPGTRRSVSCAGSFTWSVSEASSQRRRPEEVTDAGDELAKREKAVMAEQLSAAQRRVAALQLELESTTRSLGAVNEREALRRQELDGELSKMRGRLRGRLDEVAVLKDEVAKAAALAHEADETAKTYKMQLTKHREEAAAVEAQVERIQAEHASAMKEVSEQLLVATAKASASAEAVVLLEADRDAKASYVQQALQPGGVRDELAGMVASSLHAGKMASLADQRSSELRRAKAEGEAWRLRSGEAEQRAAKAEEDAKAAKKAVMARAVDLEQALHEKLRGEDRAGRLQLELREARATAATAGKEAEQARQQAGELRSRLLQMFFDTDAHQETIRLQELKIVQLYDQLQAALAATEALKAAEAAQGSLLEVSTLRRELQAEQREHENTSMALEGERRRSYLLQSELQAAKADLQRLEGELERLQQQRRENPRAAEPQAVGALEPWQRPGSTDRAAEAARSRSLNAALEQSLEAACADCLAYVGGLEGILAAVLGRAAQADRNLARASDQVQEQGRELRRQAAALQQREASGPAQALVERLQAEVALVRQQLEAEKQAGALAAEAAKRLRVEQDALAQRLRAAQGEADFLRLKSHAGLQAEEREAANQLTRTLLVEVQQCVHQAVDLDGETQGAREQITAQARAAEAAREGMQRAQKEAEEARRVAREAEERELGAREGWEADAREKRGRIAALAGQLVQERELVRAASAEVMAMVVESTRTVEDTIGDERRGGAMAEGREEDQRRALRRAEERAEDAEEWRRRTQPRMEEMEQEVRRERAARDEAERGVEKAKREAEEADRRLRRALAEAEERAREAEAGRRKAEGEREELREKEKGLEAARERLEREVGEGREEAERAWGHSRDAERQLVQGKEEAELVRAESTVAVKELQGALDEAGELAQRSVDLQESAAAARLERDRLKRLLEEEAIRAEGLAQELEAARTETREKDAEATSLREQLAQVQAEVARLMNALGAGEHREADGAEKIHELQQELEMLQEGRGRDKARQAAALEALHGERRQLQALSEGLEGDLLAAREGGKRARDVLQQSRGGLERSMQGLQELAVQASEVQEMLLRVQGEAVQRGAAAEQHRRELGVQEEAKRAMADRLKRLQKDEQEYLESIGQLKFQLGESSRLQAASQSEADRLRAQVKEAQAEATRLGEQSNAFQTKVSVLAGENATINVKMQEVEASCQRLREDLAAKQAEVAALVGAVRPPVELGKGEVLAKGLEAQLRVESEQRAEAEKELAKAAAKAAASEERAVAAEREAARQRAARAAAEAEADSAKEEAEQAARERERLQGRVAAMEEGDSGRRSEAEEADRRLRRALAEAEERAREAEAGRRKAEGEREELREKEKGLEAARERLEREVGEGREEAERARGRLREAEGELATSAGRVRELEVELAVACKEVEKGKEAVKDLQAEVEKLRGETVRELEGEVARLRAALAGEQQQVVAVSASCQASNGMIRTLTEELSRVGALVQDLEQQLRSERDRGEEAQVAVARAAEKALAAEQWRELHAPRLAELEKDAANARAAREEAERALAEARRGVESALQEKERLEALMQSMEHEGSGRRELIGEMQAQMSQLSAEKRAAESEAAGLKASLAAQEAKTERAERELESGRADVERLRALLSEAEAEMACTALRIRELEAELSLAVRELEMARTRLQEVEERLGALLSENAALQARLAEYEGSCAQFEETSVRLALTVEGLEKGFAARLSEERAQAVALKARLMDDQEMLSAADCAGQELETTLRGVQEEYRTAAEQATVFRERGQALAAQVAQLQHGLAASWSLIAARQLRSLEQTAGLRALLSWRATSRLAAVRRAALNSTLQQLLRKRFATWKAHYAGRRGAIRMEQGRPRRAAAACLREWMLFRSVEQAVAARAGQQSRAAEERLREEHRRRIEEYEAAMAAHGGGMEELRRTLLGKLQAQESRHAAEMQRARARQREAVGALRDELAGAAGMLWEVRREMGALLLGYEEAMLAEKARWADKLRATEGELAARGRELLAAKAAAGELERQNEGLSAAQSDLRSQVRSLRLRLDQLEAERRAAGSSRDEEVDRLRQLLLESDGAALALEDALKHKTAVAAALQVEVEGLRRLMEEREATERRAGEAIDVASRGVLRLGQALAGLEGKLRAQEARGAREVRQRERGGERERAEQLALQLQVALEGVRIMHDVFCGNPAVSPEDVGVQAPRQVVALEAGAARGGGSGDWEAEFSEVTRQVEEALRVARLFQLEVRELRGGLASREVELQAERLELARLKGRLESGRDCSEEVAELRTAVLKKEVQAAGLQERVAGLQGTAELVPALQGELKTERVKVVAALEREAEQATEIAELRVETEGLREQVVLLTRQLEVAVTELESEAAATNKFTRCFLDISNRIEHTGSP